jgi:hypothetical protein
MVCIEVPSARIRRGTCDPTGIIRYPAMTCASQFDGTPGALGSDGRMGRLFAGILGRDHWRRCDCNDWISGG